MDCVTPGSLDRSKLCSIFVTAYKLTEYRFCFLVLGNWSGLTAIFVMERRTGYFFLHLYSPCALIVMISWISFCIPKESTAARVALGITSVLTITTILNMLNTAMPKVNIAFKFSFRKVLHEYSTTWRIVHSLNSEQIFHLIQSKTFSNFTERTLPEIYLTSVQQRPNFGKSWNVAIEFYYVKTCC